MTHRVSVTVNGRVHEREVEARLLLSDFLRHEIGLTGTHVGCEHGVCGACTVLLDGEAVRSCLMLAVQVDGLELETVEGLTDEGQPLRRLDGLLPGRALVLSKPLGTGVLFHADMAGDLRGPWFLSALEVMQRTNAAAAEVAAEMASVMSGQLGAVPVTAAAEVIGAAWGHKYDREVTHV